MPNVEFGIPGALKVSLSQEDLDKIQKFIRRGGRGSKPIKHYLLIAPEWVGDLDNASEYVRKFHPCCGFSLVEAMQSELVTIAGSIGGIDQTEEELLRKAGCKVERLDGSTGENTRALFNERAKNGKAFIGGTFRRGY